MQTFKEQRLQNINELRNKLDSSIDRQNSLQNNVNQLLSKNLVETFSK